jgi:hypothetical protein
VDGRADNHRFSIVLGAMRKLNPRSPSVKETMMNPGSGTAVRRGMGGGAVATVAMSAVMLAAQKAGFMGKLPPEKITEAALDHLQIDRKESTEDALTTVAHFAYGIGCGGLFGWLHAKTRSADISPEVKGVTFASFIWLVSYFGWVPALGIMPRPQRDRQGRPTSMLVAHWVFGGVLGALLHTVGTRSR